MNIQPRHTADSWLIPSQEPARQQAIDEILAELKEQGRVPMSSPQASFIPGSQSLYQLVIAHQSVDDAERQAQDQEPATTLTLREQPDDGTDIYDAPTGQAGRDLLNERLTQLEADGNHILTCAVHPTNRPQSSRYRVTYRPRTMLEDRVHQAIEGKGNVKAKPNKRTS
jgi:hypothetical protein